MSVAADPGEPSTRPRVNLARVVYDTVNEWLDDDASRHAATLAFYALLSLAPLLLLLVATVGVVFGDDAARGDVARELRGILGREASRGVEEFIERARVTEQGVVASIVSPLVLLFGASHVFGELQTSLNAIWGVRRRLGRGVRGVIVDLLTSFGMVIGVALLMLVWLVIQSAVPAFVNITKPDDPAFLWIAADGLISFISTTVSFAVLFKVVPDVRIAWHEAWVGAGVTASLFMVGRFLLGLYLGQASISSPHGAAGSLFVVVLWVYYSSQILFLGAEFTKVYARHRGVRIEPTERAVRIPKPTKKPEQ